MAWRRENSPQDRRHTRRIAERGGRVAELMCRIWLRLTGHRILASRYRCRAGEIDIIATKNNILIAIEVKRRANHTTALESISRRQQQRIAKSLEIYAGQNGFDGDLRCDVMTVGHRMGIRHLKNAWMI
ncbi:YraN family protein [Thalassospira sp.]|uniref:YraN family protein n=1 Tax=Thalassospira sp. TaxID=1912094 RepID=UPI0027324AF5|nr:YraN family protein [Thalassospira sp.]MDP2699181.1 YraN family protein [Thalassospira sp.]